jgi:large subunit ribosomal protein L23
MATTIWDVLKAPVITEKAVWMKEDSTEPIRDSKNKKTIKRDRQLLTFRVESNATKHAIKAAVEAIFKVKVDQVRVANYRGKLVRRGRTEGRRPHWRKAYVTLKPGFKVDYEDSI